MLGKLRQGNLEVEVSLGCTVTPAQGNRERGEEKSLTVAVTQ